MSELEKLKARVTTQVSATVRRRRKGGKTELVHAIDQTIQEDVAASKDFEAKKEEALKLAAFMARKKFERNVDGGSDSSELTAAGQNETDAESGSDEQDTAK